MGDYRGSNTFDATENLKRKVSGEKREKRRRTYREKDGNSLKLYLTNWITDSSYNSVLLRENKITVGNVNL